MDALLSIVIKGAASLAARLAADEVKLLWWGAAKESVDKLVLKLNTIQPYLHDAEIRAMTDHRIGGWLARLKDVLYEADDAIDEWNTKSRHNDTCRNAVSDFFTQIALRHKIGKEIERINNKLTDIAQTVNTFSFLTNPVAPTRGDESALFSYDAILKARMTNSTKENVIGREEEINRLKEMLVRESNSDKSEIIVISVVGPPGHGKTSLAKHMFHEIANHFTKQIWVYAPDIRDEETVIKKMLDAVKKETSVKELEGLKNILVDEFLKNNRLLLVIDDIWEVEGQIWRKLYNMFTNFVTKGSRILVTTRHEKVVQDVGSAYRMHVGPLSTEISLSILRNNVDLQGKDDGEVSDLMKIGEEILEKCGGVPLAITTMAGALRNKNTRDGWKKVLESEMWNWDPQSRGGILPALWLSYYHLSPQLKQCFRYCAIYQKGDTIVKEDVVPMWVAHGYISEKIGEEMEDIGGGYFDELVGRSLFQNAEWDEYGSIENCRMHDLVYDLSRFVTKGDVLVIEDTENESISNELSPLHCGILDTGSINKSYINAMDSFKKLRTLVSSCVSDYSFIEKLQRLRVLEWTFDKEFPTTIAICNLVHVRYLSLRATSIMVLPNSIGQLWNLQYLDLSHSEIKKLPESIKNLSNLRYLDLSNTSLSDLLPSSITELSNLRHLSLRSSKISEIPEAIGRLKLLRFLDLSYTDLSQLPSSITELSNLRHLSLERSKICEIPEAIGRLKLLRFLDLSYTDLSQLPSSITELSNLRHLSLERSKISKIPEAIERLELLRSLDLSGTKISRLPESIANLSHLQELLVDCCSKLSMLPSGICQLTGLKKLGIEWTPELRELPEGIGRLINLQRLDKFVVVEKDDDDGEGFSNMEELKQLNNLCGGLEIEILDDVGREEEATCAHLELKRYLSRITLRYNTPNQSTSSDAVLQALRPHFNLSELSIYGYPGSKLPTWLGVSSFSGLHELSLHDCTGCTTLPAIGNLPELRSLFIDGMPRVRRLTSYLFGSMHGFPKLDSLEFQNLNKWKEWEPLVDRVEDNNSLVAPIDGGGVTGEERIFTFPCLRKFTISNCPKLRSLPPIFSASLQNVDIGRSMDLSNREWSFLINIDTLTCGSAELLNRLPSLPNLRRLRINYDDVVSELSNSLLKFSSLQTLKIWDCENLKSLPEEMASLKQLRKLEIWECPLLEQSCSEGGEQWHKISHIPDISVGFSDFSDVRRKWKEWEHHHHLVF